MEIIKAIARVREFGCKKYEQDSWKLVAVERYRDSMMRHAISYIQDPLGVDEESGLPHLWHLATNICFLITLENIEVE